MSPNQASCGQTLEPEKNGGKNKMRKDKRKHRKKTYKDMMFTEEIEKMIYSFLLLQIVGLSQVQDDKFNCFEEYKYSK